MRPIRDKGGPLVLAITLGLAAIVGIISPRVSAGNNTVVSIFIDGERRTVSTEATTVGEVVSRAKLDLAAEDLVEPGLNTPIDSEIFNINVYRAKPAVVVDGDTEIKVNTAYQSPRLIAEKSAGLKVYDEDRYKTEVVRDFLDEQTVGQRIIVDRALPVNVKVGGETLKLRTQATTVAGLLDEKGMVVDGKDIVRPGLSERLKANQTVMVTRVGREVVAREEKIAHETQVIYNNDQPVGWQEVREKGQDGKKLVTYDITLHNGREVRRRVLETVVITKPVTRVLMVGNKNHSPAGNRAIGQQMALARGWSGQQWTCLEALWTRESNWDHTKYNYAGSGAYGIPQALPGDKMSSHGADWRTNPATQIAWGLDYIANRYGTPCNANSFQISNNWY